MDCQVTPYKVSGELCIQQVSVSLAGAKWCMWRPLHSSTVLVVSRMSSLMPP